MNEVNELMYKKYNDKKMKNYLINNMLTNPIGFKLRCLNRI